MAGTVGVVARSGPRRRAARSAAETASTPPAPTASRTRPPVKSSPARVRAPSVPGSSARAAQTGRRPRGVSDTACRVSGSMSLSLSRGTRAYISSASEKTSRCRKRAAVRSVTPWASRPAAISKASTARSHSSRCRCISAFTGSTPVRRRLPPVASSTLTGLPGGEADGGGGTSGSGLPVDAAAAVARQVAGSFNSASSPAGSSPWASNPDPASGSARRSDSGSGPAPGFRSARRSDSGSAPGPVTGSASGPVTGSAPGPGSPNASCDPVPHASAPPGT